jgi:hypothetical protein
VKFYIVWTLSKLLQKELGRLAFSSARARALKPFLIHHTFCRKLRFFTKVITVAIDGWMPYKHWFDSSGMSKMSLRNQFNTPFCIFLPFFGTYFLKSFTFSVITRCLWDICSHFTPETTLVIKRNFGQNVWWIQKAFKARARAEEKANRTNSFCKSLDRV